MERALNLNYFDNFIEQFISEGLQKCLGEAPGPKETLLNYFRTSVAEAKFSLELISSHLENGKRILEVGSGLGIASGFLRSQGFNITTLDPGGKGFGQWSELAIMLRQAFGLSDTHLSISAERLDPEIHGEFDLIFSNNVLEHVTDVDKTLTSLNRALAQHGTMIHNCPNYTFPYEPHFGIPLIPGMPELTKHILPKRIVETELWHSLNFISVRQVKHLAKRLNSEVSFQSGTVLKSLLRFEEDKEFGDRHPYLRFLFRFLGQGLARAVFNSLPPSLSTPMIFSWSKN